jgi:hypothetical protein
MKIYQDNSSSRGGYNTYQDIEDAEYEDLDIEMKMVNSYTPRHGNTPPNTSFVSDKKDASDKLVFVIEITLSLINLIVTAFTYVSYNAFKIVTYIILYFLGCVVERVSKVTTASFSDTVKENTNVQPRNDCTPQPNVTINNYHDCTFNN